ncbi:peroxiredoxin [Scopulibacillus darangshiensis]|uniref:Peroxiredoxin n=1 Tax=Scopulibacillus darangshiensis TaxID=442528 RepID=A0A4R2NQA7_9BACL|nr:TlpA disulfide reductase family protein [Scopulibacillus darangshiensis]TCP23505.1 peroxiredoxin [Scopulibacillus darangshiensis]
MNAPNFELFDLKSHQEVKLTDFRGLPVMITFWVSWCPDCQRDLPLKTQFYQSLDKSELGFLTINVTGREHAEKDGPRFAEEHDLPFPILIDNGTEVYDAYECSGVPTTIIMDKDHRITHQFGDKASFYDVLEALSHVTK